MKDNCQGCRKDVPFIVFEAEMTRLERINRRMWICLVIAISALFFTNTLWLLTL
jgi:hypothetical protein